MTFLAAEAIFRPRRLPPNMSGPKNCCHRLRWPQGNCIFEMMIPVHLQASLPAQKEYKVSTKGVQKENCNGKGVQKAVILIQ